MANCIYCGGPAGLLRKSHKVCRHQGEAGSPEVIFLLSKMAARCRSETNIRRDYEGSGQIYFLHRG